MSEGDSLPVRSLVARVKSLLLNPHSEWCVIAEEPAETHGLFSFYILWLAAINPLAKLIGGLLYGRAFNGIPYHLSVQDAVIIAPLDYIWGLLEFAALWLSLDILARYFSGVSDHARALKLAAYGATAWWLVGVFNLIPNLGVFHLLGFYSLYLLYLGANPMMKVHREGAPIYILIAVIIVLIIGYVLRFPFETLMLRMTAASPAAL